MSQVDYSKFKKLGMESGSIRDSQIQVWFIIQAVLETNFRVLRMLLNREQATKLDWITMKIIGAQKWRRTIAPRNGSKLLSVNQKQ